MCASALRVVEEIKKGGEDFAWYPTTPEILNTVRANIEHIYDESDWSGLHIMDIGAGDGRALMQLTDEGKRFAIEKAMYHIANLDPSICILGTDFWAENLDTKVMDVIYCNPPYFEYEKWVEKIIKTAYASYLYLVIPKSWRKSERIQKALLSRRVVHAKNSIEEQVYNDLNKDVSDPYNVNDLVLNLGEFDFLDADRKANVRVEVIRFNLGSNEQSNISSTREPRYYAGHKKLIHENHNPLKTDPFTLWFNENLTMSEHNQVEEDDKTRRQNEIEQSQGNTLKALVSNYDREMESISDVVLSLSKMKPSVLKFINVDAGQVKNSLRAKSTETTRSYWKKLYELYAPINSRLCAKQRLRMTEKINRSGLVQFTESNALAITSYAIKNAGDHIDEQIKDLFHILMNRDSIQEYKSNAEAFTANGRGWFNSKSRNEITNELHHVSLGYRIVIDTIYGGVLDESIKLGISSSKINMLNDLMIIANNLGFDTYNNVKTPLNQGAWEIGALRTMTYRTLEGEEKTLFTARAYQKGSVHIKFCNEFITAFNIEAGRLFGWVHSAEEAAEEMDIPLKTAVKYFGANDTHGKIGMLSAREILKLN